MQNATITCLAKLRAEYTGLNSATKRVADYILQNPGEVIEYNIMDLAARIGVSSFSIVNCLKIAGYSGFKEFKISMAQEYDPLQTTLFKGISKEDDAHTMFCKCIDERVHSLYETEKLISPKDISDAVGMIVASERMETYGIGYSGYAADMLSMNIRRIGKDTAFYSDPNYQVMSAVVLRPNDLAVGFSASGATKSVCEALRSARDGGTKTIAVTSVARSPITSCADLVLLTAFTDPILIKDTITSAAEQIALVTALTLAVAYQDAPHALVNLSETSSAVGKNFF